MMNDIIGENTLQKKQNTHTHNTMFTSQGSKLLTYVGTTLLTKPSITKKGEGRFSTLNDYKCNEVTKVQIIPTLREI